MSNIQLKRKALTAVAAVMMFCGFSVASSAALIDINSEMALFGVTAADSQDLTLATELSFPQPVIIAAGVNDFAFSVGSNATFNALSFDPATPGTVMTFASGGSFTATDLVVDLQTPTAINMTLAGVWSLDGFDDTLGQLVLTIDSLGGDGLFTFSASGTVTAVPVPAAVWLLGSALAGLGLTRRRA